MNAPFPWSPPREQDDEAMVAARRMVRLIVGGLIDTALGSKEKEARPESPLDLDHDPPPILRE